MNRKIRWEEVRVGIFVVASVAILSIAVVMLGERTEFFAGKTLIRTFLPNVGGLKTGAPVWLSGVEVGNVEDIRFTDPDQGGQIEVTLGIRRNVLNLVRKDSIAYLSTKGLLGDKIISISMGSTGGPPIEAGGTIAGRAPEDIFNVMGKLSEAFDYLDRVARGLDRLAGVVTEGKGTLGKLLHDQDLYDSLLKSAKNLQIVLAALSGQEGTLYKLAKDPSLYTSLKTTSERLSVLMGSIEAGQGTLGKLVVDPKLYEETQASVTQLKELIEEVKKNPKKFFSFSVF